MAFPRFLLRMAMTATLATGCLPSLLSWEAGAASLDSLRSTLLTEREGIEPGRRDALMRGLETFALTPPYDKDPALVRHYREMCDRAIDEISSGIGAGPGVTIWKFYSSGYVCRSGGIVFAFDLNQGVNAKRWTPEPGPDWKPPRKTETDFVLTDAQIARLAGHIRVAFYSHQDEDHVCHAFMQAIVAAGGTVVVPASVRKLPGYETIAARLTVLTPETGKTYRYGGLEVEGLATRQTYTAPGRPAVENNLYLVRTPAGQVLMHKGDANVGDEVWAYFEDYKRRGGRVDVYLGGYSAFGTKDKDPTGCARKIHEAFDDFVIPGHLYEWSHLAWGVKGLLTYEKAMAFDGDRIRRGRGVVLSWGERHTVLERGANGARAATGSAVR